MGQIEFGFGVRFSHMPARLLGYGLMGEGRGGGEAGGGEKGIGVGGFS